MIFLTVDIGNLYRCGVAPLFSSPTRGQSNASQASSVMLEHQFSPRRS